VSLKRTLGLDWFDLAIQVGITGMLMIIADSASNGSPGGDGAIAAVVAISLVVLAWRRQRALKVMAPFSSGEVPAQRWTEVEERLAELEGQQGRMLELEERLDFHERMLTQQRERDQIGRGG
jgi:hypothetical protein